MPVVVRIIEHVRVTKRKLALCVLFPAAADLILLFGFVCDEVLGLGGSAITHAIYSAANLLYCFIFLPLTFVDSDASAPEVFRMALILTPIWWYVLACVLAFLAGKGRGNKD